MFNLIFVIYIYIYLIKIYTSCCRLISLSSNIAAEDNKTHVMSRDKIHDIFFSNFFSFY